MRIIYSIYLNKSSIFYNFTGSSFFLKISNKTKDPTIYVAPIKAIPLIEKPRSINIPNKAVPKAVENTIKDVVKALILPINFTP